MESPVQRVRRLVGALEVQSQQSYFLLSTGVFEEGLALQERCRPLVDEIARLMLEPGTSRALDDDTQRRAQALLKKQLEQLEYFRSQKQAFQEELLTLGAVQTRTTRFRSAYVTAPVTQSNSPFKA